MVFLHGTPPPYALPSDLEERMLDYVVYVLPTLARLVESSGEIN